MKFPFLKEVGDRLVNTAHELTVYIERRYFEKNMAVELADKVSTLGIFYFGVKKTEKGREEMFRMEAPLIVTLSFSESSQVEKDLGTGPVKCTALKIGKGDTIIDNVNHVQTVDSFSEFVKFFQEGKIPEGVPYSSLLGMFNGSADINKFKKGVPSLLVEAMISEMCRDSKNDSIPFRVTAGKTGRDDGYMMLPVGKIAEVSSVFAALSFERMNDAITTSVRKTREGSRQSDSPVEKIIHY